MRSLSYLLEKMLRHCDEIIADIQDCSYEAFLSDGKTQRAIYMSLHQIGELSGRLPDSFRLQYNEIPWAGIRQVRNIISHEYIRIDPASIWATIKQDIPTLKSFLELRLLNMANGTEKEYFEKE